MVKPPSADATARVSDSLTREEQEHIAWWIHANPGTAKAFGFARLWQVYREAIATQSAASGACAECAQAASPLSADDLEQDRSDVWRALGIAQDATADDAIAAIVALRAELTHANADAAWFKQSAHSRAKQIDAIRNDAGILDWLESVLTPATPATEVFLAGLRSGPRDAEAFQCEIAPAAGEWRSFQGKTLREAIDVARAASQEGRHE